MKRLLYLLISVCFVAIQSINGQGTLLLNTSGKLSTCVGGYADGEIVVIAHGGVAPYTYKWNTGATTQQISDLPPATYVVTVTDKVKNVGVFSINLLKDSTLFSYKVTKNGGCSNNEAYGAVELQLRKTGLNIKWNDVNNSTTEKLTKLSPGTYSVSVSNNFCTDTKSIVVPIGLNLYPNLTSIKCGVADGKISIDSIEGGNAPYSYKWSNNTTNPILSTNMPGKYSVEVTDNQQCKGFFEGKLKTNCPDTLKLFWSPIYPSCSNSKDGAIYTRVEGGVPPYKYLWNTKDTTADLRFLSAYRYILTVTDSKFEEFVQHIDLFAQTPYYFDYTVTKNAGCSPNDAYGEIKLNLYGSNLSIQWDDPQKSTTPTVSNLKAGKYTVTVTDGICNDIRTIEVFSGMNITLQSEHYKCNGELSKVFIKQVEGGKAPYTYLWSDGSSEDKIFSNQQLTYSVSVTDSNGCTATAATFLTTIQPNVYARQIKNSNCDQPTGEIMLDFGSNQFLGDYTFKWDNGMTGHHISNLFPGNYTVTITNIISKCQAVSTYYVPSTLTAEIMPSIKCGEDKGLLTAKVTGGTPPYTYKWSISTDTSQIIDISNWNNSIYVALTVTDSKGCTITTGKDVVGKTNNLVAFIVSHDHLIDCKYNYEVIHLNGVAPFTYKWNNGTTATSPYISSNDFKNTNYNYSLTVTDSNGCTEKLVGTFTNLTDNYFNSFHLNICNNTAYITSPCNQKLKYKWSNGSTDSIAYGLNRGIHYVTITPIGTNTTYIIVDTFSILSNENCIINSNNFRIEGYVFDDSNKNCVEDLNETGISNRVIEVTPGPYYGTANQDGFYSIAVPKGVYSVKYIPNNIYETTCINNISTVVDSIERIDFLVKNLGCANLNLNIGIPFLRRCFDNTYNVQYCNTGSKTAYNAYIELTLDRFLTLKNATVPYSALGNNKYKVMVGNLQPNQCGNFTLNAYLNCDSTIIGQTHCIEGHIYPDSLCSNFITNWSGVKINTTAGCNGNEVILSIENGGIEDMIHDQKYIIIEDQVIFRQGNFKLNSKEKIDIKIPANGKMYRIEAQQDTTYPLLPSRPCSWVEACGKNAQGGFNTGFAPLFGNNGQAPYMAIDCKQSIGSYDPNTKQVYPLGTGTSHYINQNEDADYIIHFQNEGTDTAFTVVLKDTLSQYLDPTTLKMGASSHPYQWNLSGNGILTVTFDKINLLTKTQSDSLSQGYVKFNINQRKNVPIGSLITNQAGIYFDYNTVIMTNKVFHTVNIDFLKLSIHQLINNATVKVYPNPTNDRCTIEISGIEAQESLNLQIFNLSGQQVINTQSIGNQIIFHKNELPTGVYIFKILGNNQIPIAQGKVIFID